MGEAVSIQKAGMKDVDGMVRLLDQLFFIEKDFKFDEALHRKGLAMMLDGCGKHKTVRVAKVEGKIVGMCTAQCRISTARGGIVAVIEDLVVDSPWRGKGIGRALLESIYEWAGIRGIDHCQLLADRQNSPALDFYDKMGWVKTGLVCLSVDL